MNRPSSSPLSWLEKAVLVHIGVLLLGSTWAFGGNIWWARQMLAVWASLAPAITVAAFFQAGSPGRDARRKAGWLLPPALFALLVIASTFNPSFSSGVIGGDMLMIHTGPAHPRWPSTVNPADSLDSLWFGTGAYLSAFNLALVLRGRRSLRFVLVLVATNALTLAVFGTMQKLSGSGFYFGAAVSPNERFFSTFIYNNHWGAFMVLALSVATGLLFYHARNHRGRDLWHSPFSASVVGVLIVAATAPVSASRAATAMAALLVTVATAHALFKIAAARRHERRAVWPAVTLLLALVMAVTAAVGWLGFRSINQRYTETRRALAQDKSLWSARSELYHDTCELVRRQPVFGWGLNSYGVAFQLIRPRSIQPQRQYESSYETAHNDWLQSLAETGVVGTALLLLTLALPLASLTRSSLRHPLVVYPLTGLGVILLYACVEFPFSSGAVLFLFWTCLFTVVRYARLQPDRTTAPAGALP